MPKKPAAEKPAKKVTVEEEAKAPQAKKSAVKSKAAETTPPEVANAQPRRVLDNVALAGILEETGALLEIDNADPFRIRSYRRAAEALDSLPQQVSDLIQEPKKLLEVPGIGKGMLANFQEIFTTGKLTLREELVAKYHPGVLQLLKISGLGPKTIALLWSAFGAGDIDAVEKLAREGKIRELPRMGEKHEQKILRSIEQYRRISGRFGLEQADDLAAKLVEHIGALAGVEKTTPAGSLRRGRETVGDLDLLVTGAVGADATKRAAAIEHISKFPGISEVLVRGDNKVSFRMRSGIQVDVRVLPPETFGSALQYFTGSKQHSVTLRQRALKMGYTLSEYGLFRIATTASSRADSAPPTLRQKKALDGASNGSEEEAESVPKGELVASATEEDVYRTLGLDYIPPEMREDTGEIEAAAAHALPELITQKDIRGDVHMHTVATDGKCSIEEMIGAARERGYAYMAITDHSKNLAFANGLDDRRAEEHIAKIRAAAKQADGITCFAGIEVDILADGTLDLSDSVLEQMDVVIASVHSHFAQEPAQMTERLLRAIGNRCVSAIGHPTGRILLRRDGYAFDIEAVLKAAAENQVAMELNAYPDRLDLSDRHLRLAKERGVKIVINTDSHHTSHLEKMKYGILQARRAWLTRADVLNTRGAQDFARAMKHAW